MNPNLTPKQLRILTKIRDCRLSRGYSPTMAELGEELGVSKVTVFEHVEALIKKGALIRDPNKARSLEVNPSFPLPDETRPTRLPLVGSIAAGSPIEAVEDREHLDLETLFAPPGSGALGSGLGSRGGGAGRFVLRVRGDSMIDDHIADGDYVVCEQRTQVRNGETIVALVENQEATLKRFYREKNGMVRLQPANAQFEPMVHPADDVQVQGVVIGVIRQY